MDIKNLSALKAAHHLGHVAEMCNHLANTLEAFLEAAADDSCDDVVDSLRATAEEAAMASDDILSAAK